MKNIRAMTSTAYRASYSRRMRLMMRFPTHPNPRPMMTPTTICTPIMGMFDQMLSSGCCAMLRKVMVSR